MPMKELSIEVEMSAFMLSIALELHQTTAANVKHFHTSTELEREVNSILNDMPDGDYQYLKVECKIIHQGLRLFRKGLTILNYSMEILSPSVKDGKAMTDYMGLKAFN
jgi:hypothetical protein